MKLEKYVMRGKNKLERCQHVYTSGHNEGKQCKSSGVICNKCVRHI